jgi:hypothetical protein
MVMEKTVPATPMVEDATAPQQRARAGAAAAVEPRAVDQPLRHRSASVQVHQAKRQQYPRHDDGRRQEPKRLAEVAQ